MAPFFSGGGYCSEAVAFVMALDAHSDRPVSIDQHGDAVNRRFLQELPAATSASLQRMYRQHADPTRSVCVCHSEPGAWTPPRYPTTACPPRGARFTVGRTMFETDRLPSGWAERLNRMDEVWVPTEFHRRVFRQGGVAAAKLQVLGEPVDVDEFDPGRVDPLPFDVMEGPRGQGGPWQSALEASDGSSEDGEGAPSSSGRRVTRFLSVFKWEYRKGWDVLLKAYLGGFTATDPAVLYVLTSAYHSSSDFSGEMQRFMRANLDCATLDSTADAVLDMHGGGDGQHSSAVDDALPRPSDFCIEFPADGAGAGLEPADLPQADEATASRAAAIRASIRRIPHASLPRVRLLRRLSQGELPGAYRSADALVLPSRGEGWGRPHAEAMAMALPVLATNWSGPTAFLNERNGIPLPFTHLRPIPEGAFAGHLMAEPDERALRDAMRWVSDHPQEAAELGAQARRDMVERFSPGVFAEKLEQLIGGIEQRLKGQAGQARGAARSEGDRSPRQPADADEAVARAIEREARRRAQEL
ncbi:hypothetical protein FNF27_00062 [Cafeteria roenbergensis]|uniref:Uncharacterized protein n=1 Tax=Cafeteria roenbergensis TaxID=33653 RepID=A0A5A8EMB2_CAFRO|nr:hypothetical protein FNF27_00062 [Cafeteria roenbergensis]